MAATVSAQTEARGQTQRLRGGTEFAQALALQSQGRRLEAARGYISALRQRPDFFEAAFNLGVVFQELHQTEEAIACYQRALGLKPDFGPAWNNLGTAFQTAGRHQQAVAAFQKALGLQPGSPDALCNLGNSLRAEQRHDEAVSCLREAVRLAPANASILSGLGNALRESGRLREAEDAFRRAIGLQPELAEAHWNLAFVQLLRGELARGFEEYEWRWRRTDFPPRQFNRPLWRGEDLPNKTLLVWAEQGAGDAIQFVRFIKVLSTLGARVVLECPRPLKRLFETVAGAGKVVAKGDALPEFDWQVPLLSLPHRLGITLDSLPAAVPYLSAPESGRVLPPASTSAGDATFKVGVVWRGNPHHENDRQRSLSLSMLEAVFEVDGATFYSLQVAPGQEFSDEAASQPALTDLSGWIGDFGDTAEIVQQLDLVISVDTSVAHLAGALGKPVWLLLPFAPDWRWLLGREDSPWYPTMRLFRQLAPGDWTIVAQQVRAALEERVQRENTSCQRFSALEDQSKKSDKSDLSPGVAGR